MSLPHLLERVRAARMAAAHPAQIFIWCDDEDGAESQIAAARSAGRIGPHTVVNVIRWKTDKAAMAVNG
jgi:hypothetical protein